MFNQTVYNLRKNLEAKRTAQRIVDYLERREKNLGFRNFLIQNITLLREAKDQKKDPNEALEELKNKYHQNLEEFIKKGERFAELTGQLVIAKEKQTEEKQENIKKKRKKKKRRRKKKKKTIQKYNEEINKNYKEQSWAEVAMLEEELDVERLTNFKHD